MTDRRKENIKNLLLVVLFSTTILLLYLLWSHDASSSFSLLRILSGGAEEADIPGIEEVAVPRYVAVSSGNGVFRFAEGDTSEVSAQASACISEACAQGQISVSEISSLQYSTVMSRYDSVQIALSCDVPFSDFNNYHGIRAGTPADSIQNVSVVAFSEASGESIFIYDGPQNRFFRLRTSEEHDYCSRLSAMCSLAPESFYNASEILGYGNAYIPVGVESSLSDSVYVSDAATGGRDLRTSMAEAVMGENFDFVRRISDGFGNITYMYGYGQKTFTAGADGSFEYRSEVSTGSAGDFYADLRTAIAFTARCGGWPLSADGSSELILDRADSFSEGRSSGHSYYFVQLCGSVPVRGEDGYAVEISVTNGQVSYFRRYTISASAPSASGRSMTAEPVNVIANNCNHIYNVMHNNTLVAAVDEAFSNVSEALTGIHQGYFISPGRNTLVPCWIVRTNDGSEFFFDLYDAAPLGFSRQEQYGLE